MLIGIISDSHDNLPALKAVLGIFTERGAEQVIHAGDLVSPFTLEPFKEAGLPLIVVLGNNEGERKLIAERFGALGFPVHEEPFSLEMMGKNVVVCHRPQTAEPFIGESDIVICGHNHRLLIETRDNTLVINPGELGGWLFGKKTGVLLKLPEMETEVLEID